MFTKADCSKNLQIDNRRSSCLRWSHFIFDRFCSKLWLPNFCAPPSEVAGLFDSNLSRCALLGKVVDLDLLLSTGFDSEHAVLFLSHISTQPTNDRKMERNDGCGFGRQQLLANSFVIFISHEKKSDWSRPEIYKALNPC